mmetsp:Transcript_13905/g.16189  ORF Transcript_13905/g.16189 Transcript_13905/m.16189 type:complete len:106 (-) Transcript_13905:9-326(-)
MSQKAHGTCVAAPQNPLRWDADYATADRISCFNRHYAEFAGSWERTGLPADIASQTNGSTIMFYDSVTGKALFEAPVGRSWENFNKESQVHGWPSFRDEEVVIET